MPSTVYGFLTLRGNQSFITKTQRALKYIERRTQGYLQFVEEHINVIAKGPQSGVSVTDSVFYVGSKTYCASTEWYASCIVHDATHVWLYRQGKPHGGREAENVCLDRQREFLIAAGAESSTINYITYLIDNAVHYFSNPKRNW